MANSRKNPGKKRKGVARFITPPNKLKQKVGNGGIPESLLSKAQEYIENNPLQFEPFAQDFLQKLNDALVNAKGAKTEEEKEDSLEKIISLIMQLKANGAMFKYELVTYIADTVLYFLENIETINKDVFNIVQAHNNCLTVIIQSKLQGDGGQEGVALIKELQAACDRYNKKYNAE